MIRCPGQDQRFWKPKDIFEIECPECNYKMEFFKDEPKLKCRNCGKTVVNPKINLGCVQWCKYAEQCLDVPAVKNLRLIRDKLIDDMKAVFSGDQKRIEHTLAVLEYAEQIQAVEGGDPLIIRGAAILHDIGVIESERKYKSSASKYPEIEGPPIARKILKKYHLDETVIEHICRIIANHHNAKDVDTHEFRIIWDADWLVNIPKKFPEGGKEKLKDVIDKIFKTKQGHQIALKLFL